MRIREGGGRLLHDGKPPTGERAHPPVPLLGRPSRLTAARQPAWCLPEMGSEEETALRGSAVAVMGRGAAYV